MIREIPLISDDSDLKEKNNADHGTTLFTQSIISVCTVCM